MGKVDINYRETDKMPDIKRHIVPDDSFDIDATDRPVTFRLRDNETPIEVPLHNHRRAQLLFAEKGIMQVHTDAGIWVVPPQRAVWLPSGVDHGVVSSGALHMRNLYFEPRYCEDMPKECCVVTVTPLMRELILHAVTLPAEYDENGPDGRLFSVLLDQIKVLPVAPLHLPSPHDKRAKKIAQVISEVPSDGRTLDDWGKEVGASSRTLARVFKCETGLTFGQWRQQARLLAGLEMLAANTPISVVAFELGYDSVSAFTAMFRRAMGKPPGKFFNS